MRSRFPLARIAISCLGDGRAEVWGLGRGEGEGEELPGGLAVRALEVTSSANAASTFAAS